MEEHMTDTEQQALRSAFQALGEGVTTAGRSQSQRAAGNNRAGESAMTIWGSTIKMLMIHGHCEYIS